MSENTEQASRAYPQEAEDALKAWLESQQEGVWTSPAGWWYAAWMHRERDLGLALKDNANYRATVQRLMRDARLKDAVVEAARRLILELVEPVDDLGVAVWLTRTQKALDAAQQQPTEPDHDPNS